MMTTSTVIVEMNAMEQIFNEVIKKPAVDPVDMRISYALNQLGIRPHVKGYKYLKDAIRIGIESPEDIEFITKTLYPAVAKKNKTTWSRVERAIRHAIKDVDQIDEFRRTIFLGGSRDHYTNKEFIAGVAEYFKGLGTIGYT